MPENLLPSFVAYVYVRDTTENPLRLAGEWPDTKTAGVALQQILAAAKLEGFLYPKDFDSSVGLRFVPYHAIDEACIEPNPIPSATLKVA